MEASITLKNVSKHFKKKYVLSNITIGIEKGSAFAIIGRDGAGKSTLLRIISTLLNPDKGTVYINDKDISNQPSETKKVIGYLPDHDMHDSWLTGWENLKLRARLLDIRENEFESRLNPLIREFDMESEIYNYPVTYSRGIKRRLDLIQVLMGEPEVLILDEPMLGMDYHARIVLLKYLLKEKGKKTIVIASNEFTEIQTIADRWIVLHNGKIKFDGTMEKMLSQVEIPFIGNIELKSGRYDVLKTLRNSENIREVREFGKTIQISTDGLKEFCHVLEKIGVDSIVGFSGHSISVEEFLDQLTSDEGY